MKTHADKTTETKSNAAANNMAVYQRVGHQSTDNRPESIAQKKIQETANNSEQVKQLRALQKMINNSQHTKKAGTISGEKTVQGFFFLGVQKTNDKVKYSDDDALWVLVKAEFVSLGMESTFLETLKVPIMQWARAKGKYSFEKVKTYLEGLGLPASKAKGEEPMSGASPTGMSSLTPEFLGDRVKHSTVSYTFNDAAAVGGKTKASFDLDKYTKKGESDLTAGGWRKEVILMAIRFWSMKAPLVQHLAQFVLPTLKPTPGNKKWEMYLREMERVLTERTTEAMNREFSIQSKDGTKTVDFVRKPIEQAARVKVQEKLLAKTAPPGSQDEVYFIDDLIRAKLDAEHLSDWYTTAAGTQIKFNSKKIKKNPGMTLVHWRTILLFDWQAGHEIYQNGV